MEIVGRRVIKIADRLFFSCLGIVFIAKYGAKHRMKRRPAATLGLSSSE